ncbi:unnamed protein product [Cunninghamella echinulata]
MFVPTIKYKRVPEPTLTTSKDSIRVVVEKEKQQLSTTKTDTAILKYIEEEELTSIKKKNTTIVKNKEEEKEEVKQTSKTKTDTDILQEKDKKENQTSINKINCDILKEKEEEKKIDDEIKENTITFEESTTEPNIIVDPKDNEQLLITLSDGTQYTTDRYCPHAGADLSYLGQVDEDEYPPEIGPILVCTLHYWEYALKRGGRGANGVATINACPVNNQNDHGLPCPAKKELDW